VANAYTSRKLSARYPTDLAAWKNLAKHYREDMRARELRDLFARDKKRAERFSLTANDLTLDYSKTHVIATTKKLFAQLARQAGVPAAIEAMSELGYDLSTHESKSLDELPQVTFDFVATMGCGDACPMVRARQRADWSIPDPKHLPADEFRVVRDLIHARVRAMLDELDSPPGAA